MGTSTAVTVQTSIAKSASVSVPVVPLLPGVFFDQPTGYAAALASGTTVPTQVAPVARGSFVEVYVTGLGPVHNASGLQVTVSDVTATVAGIAAKVVYSGLAPAFLGLYQVNVQIPDTTPSGKQPLLLKIGDVVSNSTQLQIQ